MVLIIKEVIKKVIEEVSKFYDIEILTEDKVKHELKKLNRKYKSFNEVLALMESIEGKHPDIMEFYEKRGKIGNKIIALENYYSYRHNFFIKAIINKGVGINSARYANFDDWEVK